MKKKSLALTLIAASLALTVGAADNGFRPLFNGTNTFGWHLRKADGHNSWSVEQGVLKNTVKQGEHGTDLVTDQKFQNFTVKYEFMVPDNSNSGFYLRGRHEIQILGDFAKGTTTAGGNGAIYNFKAPDKFVSKPGGEWQTAEATIIGNKITVVLNGVKIHDNVECNKATGSELDDKVDQPGAIFLQGDHGTVWFRNMQIKELKESAGRQRSREMSMKTTASKQKAATAGSALSRRQFIGSAVLASVAFTIVPSHVLGRGGFKPPSEKLNIAGIGIGGQGGHDLSQMTGENIVALCDVDSAHAGGIFRRYSEAKVYQDYRKMLEEQKDIDAVVIATPDHQHAIIAMAAMRLGKHVYCEKPLTHTVWEARQLTKAAREFKVATQMGNQGQASEETRRLSEFIMADAIGPVREVHIWTDRPSNGLFNEYWPQGVERPKETPAVPNTLGWDLWLGPAPQRPYHPIYVPFRWRGWWDFGTGALGDIGCHSFDPVFRALKLGAPLSVEASSNRVNRETYPLASMVTYQFPARGEMPPVKLVWYDGGLRPPRPEELEPGEGMAATGHLFIGDKGKIINQGGYRLLPTQRAKEYGAPPKKLPRSAGHYLEWIAACKGGQAGGSNFDWAGPLTEAVLLGNVALRQQLREELTTKKLLWDSSSLRFTNSDNANQFLKTEYRQGWTL